MWVILFVRYSRKAMSRVGRAAELNGELSMWEGCECFGDGDAKEKGGDEQVGGC